MNLIGIFALLASATASQANALTPNFLRGASRHLQSTCTIDTSLDDACSTTTGGIQCQTFYAGQTIEAGTVCLQETSDSVITVTVLTTGGWELKEVHADWGENEVDFPQNNKGNPKIGNFRLNSGDLTGTVQTTYTFDVNLRDNELCCTEEGGGPVAPQFLMAVHAAVRKADGFGGFQEETAWGNGGRFVEKGSWATFFNICLECPIPDDGGSVPSSQDVCETAFAYDNAMGTCFLDIDEDQDSQSDFNRWGWTIGPLQAQAVGNSYNFPIYAGAGQCDTSKGTHVGYLEVTYDGSMATVTFERIASFTWGEVHVYVGTDILASDVNDAFTVAPGQYPHVLDSVDPSSETVEVTGLSGPVHVVAHAVACGFEAVA